MVAAVNSVAFQWDDKHHYSTFFIGCCDRRNFEKYGFYPHSKSRSRLYCFVRWLFFPSHCRSPRRFFSDIHRRSLVKILEIQESCVFCHLWDYSRPTY
ncbi:uncharacterized protein LOC111177462 isoform X5 [Delphinapterus leucas]|uniref:Uncharacterized protein LOC111177462 isoform X5 n=1 Tax=Delphinapterus leucas TaxID=9749 RepID=A0A7F8KD21_DELLE|nr:uncharacterized protein LOC111177462 isoform X5 [Delphinapterus leucas]